jgi:disulfide bond formation protein DsbB
MTAFVANLLAILAIVAILAAVVLLVFWVINREPAAAEDEPMTSAETPVADEAEGAAPASRSGDRLWLTAAWIVPTIAMSGSLYFSEVAQYVPCVLCWYQRIAMYPLVVLLGIAALRGQAAIRPYVLALSLIGGAISAYHIMVQRIPNLPTGSCSLDSPCTAIYVEVFGFVSIPVMAFSAFLLIAALMLAGPLLAPRLTGTQR